MLICSKCQTKFEPSSGLTSKKWCPRLKCGGYIVDVDENLFPILLELNKKGYHSSFCRSGKDDSEDAQILFDGHIFIDESFLPPGFVIDKGTAIRMKLNNATGHDRDKEVHMITKMLFVWVKKLPEAQGLVAVMRLDPTTEAETVQRIKQDPNLSPFLEDHLDHEVTLIPFSTPKGIKKLELTFKKLALEYNVGLEMDLID